MEQYILNSFKEKYGDETFNDIKEIIKNEIKNSKYSISIDNNYLLYIFEIAILDKCDVGSEKIATVIKRMGNKYVPQIDFRELQEIHKNSISLIKKYL